LTNKIVLRHAQICFTPSDQLISSYLTWSEAETYWSNDEKQTCVWCNTYLTCAP